MDFKYIKSICTILLLATPIRANNILNEKTFEKPTQTQVNYQKILQVLELAHTEQQLFEHLKTLTHINIDNLSHPFELLLKLSQKNILNNASLPIKTYYTHQLYLLSIKIFYAQTEKKQYISAEEKKVVIENLKALLDQTDHAKNSTIINNINAVIAFIKAIPQNELSRKSIETTFELATILLNKKNTTKKERSYILHTELKIPHTYAATYLLLLELLKDHYIEKTDQQAFLLIEILLNTPEHNTTVQYRLQQLLGEILRTLMDQGKQYEAYYYLDQLIPFIPDLFTPLSNSNAIDDAEMNLLAQGLLIEWCLIQPYLYLLFDLKIPSDEQLENKIQEKINQKDLQEWLPTFKEKIAQLGLLTTSKQRLNSLQNILLYANYFRTLNFILTKDKNNPYEAKNNQNKIDSPLNTKKDQAMLKLISQKNDKIDIQTETILQELRKLKKLELEHKKMLQVIKKNTKKTETKKTTLLPQYKFLHPPYIWIITLLLLLLFLFAAALHVQNFIKKRRGNNPEK